MDTDVTETQISDSGILDDAYNFVSAKLGDQSLGDDLLASIEKWVAAHMVSVGLDRQLQRGKGGPAEATYAGNYGMNLQMTSYGQMACSLDSTGILAGAGGKAVYIGAVPSFS
jgi:hypothetical protein